jgi:hypothetical protein
MSSYPKRDVQFRPAGQFSSQAKLAKGSTTTLFLAIFFDGTFKYPRRQSGSRQGTNEAPSVDRWDETGPRVKSPKIYPVPALVIDGQRRAQFCDQFPHRVKVNHLGVDKPLRNIFVRQVLGHISHSFEVCTRG